MKLLLLIDRMDRGGAETHLCDLATALAEKGHRVTVMSSGGALVERLAERGVSHRALPMRRSRPFSLLVSYLRLRRWIKRGHWDLIHAHARLPAFLAAPIAKRCGVPFVTTVHARFRAKGILGRLSRWGERSIAVGEDLKQYLCEVYGMDSERIRVIPNGIDTDRFCPKPTAVGERRRVLFLSRLDEDCSRVASLLIAIAPAVRKRFPDAEILLAGGGNAYESLKEKAENLNREAPYPMVTLTGWVERPEDLLRSADVFVGVSRAALEAMACGIPTVLAGDEGFLGIAHGVLPLAEQSNFCCRGCGAATEEGLLEAVRMLLAMSPQDRRAMGDDLRAYVKKRHSLVHMVKETERFYRETSDKPLAKGNGKTVLCGYYGFGNMGDDALLRASIRRAKQKDPSDEVVALTRRGKRDEVRFGIPCVRRTSFFAIRKALRGADRLVFGGGTLLQEVTSLRSLCYYVFLLCYAQKKGISTELWGNGLGEPRTALGRRLLKRALSGCDRIGVRDKRAEELARGLLKSGEDRIVLEKDLAMEQAAADEARISFLLRYYRLLRQGGRPISYVIVAPKGKRADSDLCRRLEALRGNAVSLLFVPMYPREDGALCHALCHTFGGVVSHGLGASDLLGLAARAEAVLGQRLHALMFAAMADVPYERFGNDPKLQAFPEAYRLK